MDVWDIDLLLWDDLMVRADTLEKNGNKHADGLAWWMKSPKEPTQMRSRRSSINFRVMEEASVEGMMRMRRVYWKVVETGLGRLKVEGICENRLIHRREHLPTTL